MLIRRRPNSGRKTKRLFFRLPSSVVVRASSGYRLLALIPAGDTPASTADLHRNGRFDGRVRVVADKLEVLKLEIVEVFHCRI